MDFGRLLAKIKTIGAGRQRWLVIGVVAGVLALVLYAVVRQTPPSKPRPAGPAKQRQVFVPTDLDKKLGVGGLTAEMERLRQQSSELKRKVEEMEALVKGIKEQKAQAPDLQTFRQEVDRQIHEALQKQMGKLEKQEMPPEKSKAPSSGKDKEWWRELESAGGKQAAAPDKKPAPPPAKPGPGRPADLGKPEAAKPGDIRVVSAKDSQKAGEERASRRKEEPGTYLPSGSIFSGTLLTGVDMPTGEGARRDPLPILLRIKKEAILPNRYRTDVRECFLVASGWGDLSAERAYLRAERLSCIRADGKALENRVEMYAVGEDGKAGVRGRVVNKTGALLGETFMVFDPESDICLNPFNLVQDYNEEADILAELVAMMAAPTETLTDFQTAGLKRVLKQVWEAEGPEMTVDSLARALRSEEDSRLQDLGEQLYPFTSKGEYGRFFNGLNNVNFQGRLIVVELEELRGRKHLQQVVLLQLIYQIQQEMYLGQRNQRKLVIIDEAWDLLTQGNVAGFIEHGFRRFRKYGGAAIVVTQSVNDLYNSPSGEAIAENSAIKMLLGQTREAISRLEQSKRIDLGEYGYSLLKTVHTIPGRYSEVAFLVEGSLGIGRLYVEPFKKVLYSTKAEEVYAVQQWQAQGLSLLEAVERVAAGQYPAPGGQP